MPTREVSPRAGPILMPLHVEMELDMRWSSGTRPLADDTLAAVIMARKGANQARSDGLCLMGASGACRLSPVAASTQYE